MAKRSKKSGATGSSPTGELDAVGTILQETNRAIRPTFVSLESVEELAADDPQCLRGIDRFNSARQKPAAPNPDDL